MEQQLEYRVGRGGGIYTGLIKAAEKAAHSGLMRVLDQSGDDDKITWDSRYAEEVAAAKKQFDALKKKGYLAFKVKKDGKPGEMLKEFEPLANEIVMTPPVRGG
jgi:hypothetical protein